VNKDYYNRIHALLAGNAAYPPKSVSEGEEGDCRVKITFARNGQIVNSELVTKTDYPRLNNACLETVKKTAHFPPVAENESPGSEYFEVILPINFKLTEGP
jgi:TonB family protein